MNTTVLGKTSGGGSSQRGVWAGRQQMMGVHIRADSSTCMAEMNLQHLMPSNLSASALKNLAHAALSQNFIPWSPLNHLFMHLVLVTVACGPNMLQHSAAQRLCLIKVH